MLNQAEQQFLEEVKECIGSVIEIPLAQTIFEDLYLKFKENRSLTIKYIKNIYFFIVKDLRKLFNIIILLHKFTQKFLNKVQEYNIIYIKTIFTLLRKV